MPAHASWRTRFAGSWFVLVGPIIAAGCEPSVSARAVWIDVVGGEGSQIIHVYDQGERREIEVETDEPITSVRLDRRGRGLLVRAGDQRAAWIDLADDRRLPILLPPPNLVGVANVGFAEDGSALIWSDFDPATAIGSLAVLPVAPGLPLARSEPGGIQPLVRAGAPRWWLSARAAPVALIAETDGTIGLWRWPSDTRDAMVLDEFVDVARSDLPSNTRRLDHCSNPSDCAAWVAIDPEGELALIGDDLERTWQRLDARAPLQDDPVIFPSELEQLRDDQGGGLGLLAVLDREHSLWLSGGGSRLHWWDHRTDELRTLPVLGAGPFHHLPIEAGRGALLIATNGPILRADGEGLRPVSLVTTPCVPASVPVASPRGGWISWTCFDAITELAATQGVVVRVSALGLDRFSGVPMTPLAIDDEGHLLLASVENIADDSLDGVDAQDVPRNLFVLSREGVLTRIDELEPAPAAVFVDSSEYGAFIQAASF
ncbi:hypothetical protein ACNOYE_32370 [Nannocystaceae bacterium ST9]